MTTYNLLLCLLVSLCTPAYLYNTHRPCTCCAPIRNEEETCKYYENPVLIPLFQSRDNHQTSFPVYSSNQCQQCGGTPPAPVHRKRDVKIKPRSGLYFTNPLHGNGIKPKDNINFGYLNFHKDLKSIGDLMQLSSDEIGYSRPAAKKEPVKLWKLDDMKSLSVPKLLPDVLLDEDNQETIADSDTSNFRDGVIDEHDRKLGRFVVEDAAPPKPVIMNVGKSDLPQTTQDNIKLNKQHIMAPTYNIPEVVVDKITPRKELDFMEQLQQIKLGAQTTPAYSFVEKPHIEELFTEATPHIERSMTEASNKEHVADKPEVTSTCTTTERSNLIEKDNIPKASDRKNKNTNKKTKVENEDISISVPSVKTPAKKTKTKKSKRVKETMNTFSRFSDYEGTLLDGLLSVM